MIFRDPSFLFEFNQMFNSQLTRPNVYYKRINPEFTIESFMESPNLDYLDGDANFHYNGIPSFLFKDYDFNSNLFKCGKPSINLETFFTSFSDVSHYNLTLMANMQNEPKTIDFKTPVYSSSFKDQFIYNYHNTVFQNKLTAHSGSSNRLILKHSYQELIDLAEIKYKTDLDDLRYNSVECFIGPHTYYRLTHNKELNEYYLNLFFTYDETMKNYFSAIKLLLPSPHISWVTGVNSEGGLIVDEIPIECPEFIHDSFYPWLGVKEDGSPLSLDEYIDSYLNSHESVLLLYGEKGQGKSTLLKYLLHKSGNSATITYQDNIADLDILFSQFMRSEDKILIIEDAETFLTKRESGNSSMRRLLNIADGLTSRKDKKVIFTTNLSSLSRIDDALLRDGRCYDAVKFEVFNKQESENIAKVLNIDLSLLTKDQYILAELFSISNNKLKRKKIRNGVIANEKGSTGIGFSPN